MFLGGCNMKKRKLKMKFVFFCIMIISSVIFLCVYINQQKLIDKKNVELKTIEDKIESEKITNKELKVENKQVNSAEFIEKIAREKLNMVKPGEVIYVDINNN
jgi:cell division protein FtsL